MTTEQSITVILIDDHELFRDGLAQLLQTEPSINLVATGSNGPEAVTLATQHKPDVVILDVEMPGQSADITISQLQSTAPQSKIVIVTMHEDSSLVQQLLHAGAAAFLVKTVGRQELVATVCAAAQNGDDMVTVTVPRSSMHLEASHDESGSFVSERELEVIRLLAQARSNAEIARELFITEGTVKRHLNNIYRKLGAKSRMDAVQKAIESKILQS